jgi:hypothetical protein
VKADAEHRDVVLAIVAFLISSLVMFSKTKKEESA